MGSAAPSPNKYDPARALLQLLLVHVKAHAHKGEPDLAAMKEALDAALDDPVDGDLVRLYLTAYLGRCLADSIPDHTVWTPPRLPG
jgi:hypothetical protein